MPISRIRLENFGCFRELEFWPRPRLNLIVGPNNSGKSTILAALDSALGRSLPVFGIESFFATTKADHPKELPTLRIDIEFSPDADATQRTPPTSPKTFSEGFQAELSDLIDFAPTTHEQRVIYRTEAKYDDAEDRIVTTCYSLRADGSARVMFPRLRLVLRSFFPFYRADAFRDVLSELRNKRGYWGRIVDSVTVDPEVAAQTNQDIAKMNLNVRAAAPRLDELESHLSRIGEVIALSEGDPSVILNPVPAQLSDVLRNMEVQLRLKNAARPFPLDLHGDGTRSAAYLAVFRAFVGIVSKEENENIEATPILGIEEPEVHLHPHATRGLTALLSDAAYQSFVTTHSPSVVQLTTLRDVDIIRCAGQRTFISCLEGALALGSAPGAPLDPKELEFLDRSASSTAADLVFGRAVMLVEGPSELWALPYMAKALGVRLEPMGISIIAVGGQRCRPFLKALRRGAFEIPWVVLSDGEELTIKAVANALVDSGTITSASLVAARSAGRVDMDVLRPHDCFVYPGRQDFESAVIHSGGLTHYQAAIHFCFGPTGLSDWVGSRPPEAPNVQSLPLEEQIHQFVKIGPGNNAKPILAKTVAKLLTVDGTDASRIPPVIRDAVRRVDELASDISLKKW